MNTEKWLPVVCYESLYEVSNFGRVRSLDHQVKKKNGVVEQKRGTVLRPQLAGKGYFYVTLYYSGIKKQVAVHRLVAMAFIGADNGMHVNHIDLDKTNNIVENLEWVTRSGNAQHAKSAGRYILQHAGGRTLARNNPRIAKKLTLNQVEEIKRLAASGNYKQKDIASQFGITQAVVSKINRGAIWGDKVRISAHVLAAPVKALEAA